MAIPKDLNTWWDQKSSREKLFTKIKPKMFGAKFISGTVPEKTANSSLVSAVQEKFNDRKFVTKPQTPVAKKPSIVSILSETGLIESFPKTKGKRDRDDETIVTSVTSSMSSMQVVTELTETVYKARKVIGKVVQDEVRETITDIQSDEKSVDSDDASELAEPKADNRKHKGDNERIYGQNHEKSADIKNKNVKSKWKADMEMIMAKQSTNQTREDILTQKDSSLKAKQKLRDKIKLEDDYDDDKELDDNIKRQSNYNRKHMKQQEENSLEPDHRLHRSGKFHGLIVDDHDDSTKPILNVKPHTIQCLDEEEDEETEEDISAEFSPKNKPMKQRGQQPQFMVEELDDNPKFKRGSKAPKEKPKLFVRPPSRESVDTEQEEEIELAETIPSVEKHERKMMGYPKKVTSRAPTPYYHHESDPAEDEDEVTQQKQEAKKKRNRSEAQTTLDDEEFLRIAEESVLKRPAKGKKKMATTSRQSTPYQSRDYQKPEEPSKAGRKRTNASSIPYYLDGMSDETHGPEIDFGEDAVLGKKKKINRQATADEETNSYLINKKKKEKRGHLASGTIYDQPEKKINKQEDKKKSKKVLEKEERGPTKADTAKPDKKKSNKAPHQEENALGNLPSPHKHKADHKTVKVVSDEIKNEDAAFPEIIQKTMEYLAEELAISGNTSGKKSKTTEKTLRKYQTELMKLMGQASNKPIINEERQVQKRKHDTTETTEEGRSTLTDTESGRRSRASTSSIASAGSSSVKSTTPISRVEHKRKRRTLEITLHVATLSSVNEEEQPPYRSKKHSTTVKSEKEPIDDAQISMLPFVKMAESTHQPSVPLQSHHSINARIAQQHAQSVHETVRSSDSHKSKKGDTSSKPVNAQVSVKSVLDHIPDLIPADAELTTAEEEDIRYIVSQIISTQMSQGDLTADGISPEEAKKQAQNVQSLISQILSPKNSRGDSQPAVSPSPETEAMQESEDLIKAIAEQSSMNNYNIDAVLRSVAAILAKQEELIELSTVDIDTRKADRKSREKKMPAVQEQEPDSEEESSKFSVSEVAIANDSELVDNSDAMDDLATIADDVSMGSSYQGSLIPPGEETITEEPTMMSESRSVSAAKGSSGTEWSHSDTNSGEEAPMKKGGKVMLESAENSETSLRPSSTNVQSGASADTFSIRRRAGECKTIEEEKGAESNSDSDNENQKAQQVSKRARTANYAKARPLTPAQKAPASRSARTKNQNSSASKFAPAQEESSSSGTESID